MDFGCVTIDDSLKLYLFGTPGQDRFGFMWDDLVNGALGALVVVDSGRLDDCYPAVDYFERAGLPFVVGGEHLRRPAGARARRGPLGARRRRTGAGGRLRRPGTLSVRDALLVVLEQALNKVQQSH